MNEELDEAMPRTDSPQMVEIKFSVPAPLLEDLLAIAQAEGWKPAELHRVIWERGFAAYAEGSNKRLVNRKLRNQEESE